MNYLQMKRAEVACLIRKRPWKLLGLARMSLVALRHTRAFRKFGKLENVRFEKLRPIHPIDTAEAILSTLKRACALTKEWNKQNSLEVKTKKANNNKGTFSGPSSASSAEETWSLIMEDGVNKKTVSPTLLEQEDGAKTKTTFLQPQIKRDPPRPLLASSRRRSETKNPPPLLGRNSSANIVGGPPGAVVRVVAPPGARGSAYNYIDDGNASDKNINDDCSSPQKAEKASAPPKMSSDEKISLDKRFREAVFESKIFASEGGGIKAFKLSADHYVSLEGNGRAEALRWFLRWHSSSSTGRSDPKKFRMHAAQHVNVVINGTHNNLKKNDLDNNNNNNKNSESVALQNLAAKFEVPRVEVVDISVEDSEEDENTSIFRSSSSTDDADDTRDDNNDTESSHSINHRTNFNSSWYSRITLQNLLEKTREALQVTEIEETSRDLENDPETREKVPQPEWCSKAEREQEVRTTINTFDTLFKILVV